MGTEEKIVQPHKRTCQREWVSSETRQIVSILVNGSRATPHSPLTWVPR